MNIEIFRDYCLALDAAEETFPFGDDTIVFKVNGKIFAMANLDGETALNIKCDPAYALELREMYPSVTPGYHMNKKHWNTVVLDGSVPDRMILDWIAHSYKLVKK
jgi:predicted DNA-binding protein (MmcQ/YjbR family)